ncbi:MAG: nucleotide exchange factor GrpE [Endozoicomonas sp. (ex Botrylloides leachii)]|nr:nucleotide exchange factor GrpE [Endozoicomonas sp. (ex Botrylloides leachii)]
MTAEQKAEAISQPAHDPILDGEITEKEPESVEEKQAQATENKSESIDNLQQQIETLSAALEKAQDQELRAHAEVQNIKRRAEKDIEKAHKFALDKFVASLLPVVDSLEKGIESVAESEEKHEAIKEGMALTLKLFLDTFARFKVNPINPEGEPFDPHFHQAMSMVPNPEVEPNTIMDVFQKGYTLNGRVVRPAMVVVSKGE